MQVEFWAEMDDKAWVKERLACLGLFPTSEQGCSLGLTFWSCSYWWNSDAAVLIHWPLGFRRYFQFFNRRLRLMRVGQDLEMPSSAGKCASTRKGAGITTFLCTRLAISYRHSWKRTIKAGKEPSASADQQPGAQRVIRPAWGQWQRQVMETLSLCIFSLCFRFWPILWLREWF